jgi:hypothetical protein
MAVKAGQVRPNSTDILKFIIVFIVILLQGVTRSTCS